MLRRWAGPLITILIGGGVALLLVLNLNLSTPRRPSTEGPQGTEPPAPVPSSTAAKPAGFREYPIGDEVQKNQMRIAAVWLPPIAMEGMPALPAGGDVIHLEADIHATEGNANGFAKDEFVPYLKIRYAITAADGGAVIHQGAVDANDRPRRPTLRRKPGDAEGRRVPAHLLDRAPLGGRSRPPLRSDHRRCPLVGAVRGGL